MTLRAFLGRHDDVVRVRIARVDGSSPREVGAEMYVSPSAVFGTIGGGQLEYMALDHARQMLSADQHHTVLNVPLGPEIGQCCGGRVKLSLDLMDADRRAKALRGEEAAIASLPEVLIFGAGHVGRALARALRLLPVKVCVIDSRTDELGRVTCADKRLSALPESEIAGATRGACFVVATHDHALDFLLVAEALKRDDAAYVGMIGSDTKRARFQSWAHTYAAEVDPKRLTCPMGAAGLGDKRPEVIAAHIASELLSTLTAKATVRKRMEESS